MSNPQQGEANWDETVDLLVVGAGAGGMTAALVAALQGLRVLICEKTEWVGGTAATSAGTLWIPGNSASLRQGFSDSAEAGARYLEALIGTPAGPARTAYLSNGPAVIDYLAKHTDVQFVPSGTHPDYRGNMPGAAVSGRAIAAAPFDGRLLGADFRRVRPPIGEFLLFGGMMVGKADIAKLLKRFSSVDGFVHAGKLVTRYALDRLRFNRGTRLVMGNALVARLFYSLKKARVPIRFGTPLTSLVKNDGTVLGAELSDHGRAVRIRATRGVVLATGGIAHSEALRKTAMPTVAPHSLSLEDNTGDGITAAIGAGGVLEHANHRGAGLWTPMSRTPKRRGWRGLYPHLFLDRAKPGLMAVDHHGQRFVNEACSYHDFAQAMLDGDAGDHSAFLICSVEFVAKYGLGVIYPGTTNLRSFVETGYINVAPTLEALADTIKVPRDAFIESVRRFNRLAAAGSDTDFGRGEAELDRFNGDPEHLPNPCLAPVEGSRFVAMQVWPGDIAISAGLATDEHARVLDDARRPIGGLYACGNDMASVMEGTYPGPGTTLGPATVFGYLAAIDAAGRTAAPAAGGRY